MLADKTDEGLWFRQTVAAIAQCTQVPLTLAFYHHPELPGSPL